MYNKIMNSKYLTPRARQEIYKNENTPDHVIRHCKCVSEVALAISKALEREGFALNLRLIQDSCLFHDLKRSMPNHAEEGYEVLYNLGFIKEAEIVRDHMRHNPSSSVSDLTELDIVCIADRLVLEDEYVGLEKRMEYVLNKASSEDAIKAINAKKKEMTKILMGIEEITGKTIDEIVGEDK